MASPAWPPLTTELVDRLVRAERDRMAAWARALATADGDPGRTQIASFGQATAITYTGSDVGLFNRVSGMTPAEEVHLDTIIAFYRERQVTPLFELNPYRFPTPPTPRLYEALARRGFYHAFAEQLLYGVPTADTPPPPAHVRIRPAEPADGDVISGLDTQAAFRLGSRFIPPLIGHPEFRCYLAEVEGVPAAIAVLHLAQGVGSLAFGLTVLAQSGRGCQSALVQHRIREAARAGCDLLAGGCFPGSTSQRNQLRAGLRVAATMAWWAPLPPVPAPRTANA